MENNNIQIDYRNLTAGYQLCFNENCKVKEQCLRYKARLHPFEGRKWGPVIYPTIELTENGCRFFKTGEPRLMAWGFEKLFEDMKVKDTKKVREKLKDYLGGHGTYYRYTKGERMLTPEQQESVLNIFRSLGYVNDLSFDHYVYQYDFDH
jgi:hypothetical protein